MRDAAGVRTVHLVPMPDGYSQAREVPLKGWVEARFVLQPGDELTLPGPAHRPETDG